MWARVAGVVSRHPRRTWIVSALVLLAAAALAPSFKASGVSQTDLLLGSSEAVEGQEVLTRHFPAGSGSPAIVIGAADRAEALAAVVERDPGVSAVAPAVEGRPGEGGEVKVVDGRVQLSATLSDPADGDAAMARVRRLRDEVSRVDPGVLVGGQTAIQLDTNETSVSDRNRIVPLVLLVVLAVLMLLLRAVVAPLLLVATVVLSFAATLGVSALVFNVILGFPGAVPPSRCSASSSWSPSASTTTSSS